MTAATGRLPLTVERIVDAAAQILDDEGLDQLTTINVARRLGVTQPALYRHVDGLDELRSLVAVRGATKLSEQIAAAVAGRSGDEALFAAAQAYRANVRRHPARYLLQMRGTHLPAHDQAMEDAAAVVRGVLSSYGLDEDQVRTTHVALRSAIHGFAHLEANGALGRRGDQADADFAAFIELFAAGLRTTTGAAAGAVR